MAVRIHLASTQDAGTTATSRGEEQMWHVNFKIDGDNYLSADLTFQVVGPSTALEAQQQATERLRDFTRELAAEATKFNPF